MDPLAPIIANLNSHTRPRTWSLVITVFGDSVQHRGGVISSTRLARVLGRIGIEPGALRTALSRLASDGWVQSERAGRVSLYRLTPMGRARFIEATPRIYAPPPAAPHPNWTLSLDDDPMALKLGGLSLRPAAGPSPNAAPDAPHITGPLTGMTEAAKEALFNADHLAALSHLQTDLEGLSRIQTPQKLAPLDALAARTLLVHRWRRIVLRYPEAPAELLPKGYACPRTAMARAYAALTPQAETWLDRSLESEGEGLAPMPPADQAIALRFTAKA